MSYVVIRDRHRVLLQRRQGSGYLDNYWSNAAAGHVEAGESAIQAAVREAKEELGIELDAMQLKPLTTIHRPQCGNETSGGRIDFFFECTAWTGAPQIMEPHKASALTWFDLGQLPGKVVPHERYILERLGNGLPAIIAANSLMAQ
ncbi:NUDIX hydrolase [Glutamicibacter sp. 287]|uniref:NUDIX hydrolase n=1 Tax=unclassified Glutamicibacter TaxID=2627139 RepID=UPI0020D1D443|nr:NUDIX domain-containing protein [Glutamicibacter sp. BW80]